MELPSRSTAGPPDPRLHPHLHSHPVLPGRDHPAPQRGLGRDEVPTGGSGTLCRGPRHPGRVRQGHRVADREHGTEGEREPATRRHRLDSQQRARTSESVTTSCGVPAGVRAIGGRPQSSRETVEESLRAWNNIMYDWGGGFFTEYPVTNPSNVTLYNNTIINSDDVGIDLGGHASGPIRLANNLVQDASGFNYYFAAGFSPHLLGQQPLQRCDLARRRGLPEQDGHVRGGSELPPEPGGHQRQGPGASLAADPVLAVLRRHRRAGPRGSLGHRGGRRQRDDGGEADVVRGGGRGRARWSFGGGRGRSSTTWGSTCTARLAEGGPWTRLTASLIPGLGSSAVGQAYSLPRLRARERDALLLSPRRRGRVLEGDVPRPGLGGADGRARER